MKKYLFEKSSQIFSKALMLNYVALTPKTNISMGSAPCSSHFDFVNDKSQRTRNSQSKMGRARGKTPRGELILTFAAFEKYQRLNQLM